jgi:hypothetical protein
MRISFHNSDGSAVLPWQGITRPEVGFHEVHPRYTVLTFQIEFEDDNVARNPPFVVKLSEKRYAIPFADTIQLGSLEYYRQIEEAADGVGDKMEGRFNQDIVGFLANSSNTSSNLPDGLSGTVTWQAGNMWLYCTSLEPSSSSVLQRMKETFGTNYATRIGKSSDFALELGNAVGASVQWSSLHRNSEQQLIHALQVAEGYERIVHVYHGRVLYTDDGFSLIERLNELEKSIAACFIKRNKYAWQQEYRFAVSVGAELQPDPFLVPVSPEVKDLAVGEDAAESQPQI